MQDAAHRWESSLRPVSGFRSVVDALPLGVAVFRDAAVLYANPAISEILGYGNPDAVLQVHVNQLFSTETWRGLEPMLDAISSGVEPVLRSEGRLRCRDHRLISVDMTLLTVPFDGGDATLLVSGTPIEERADSRRAL